MESDFKIRIASSADLAAANQTKALLEQQIALLKAAGKDASILEAALKKANEAIASAGKNKEITAGGIFGKFKEELGHLIPGLDKVTGGIGKLASGPLGLISAGFGGIAAAIGLASHALREFAQTETATTKLDTALSQTGQLTDKYREKLHALAEQYEQTTGIADEEWLGVLRRLTQFGASDSTIEKSLEATKNLAAVLEGDLGSAAMIVSRAMQGNFEVLSRYGIAVDEHSTRIEKLNQLYEQLAVKGGGQLESAVQTVSGQFRLASLNTANFFKSLGELIAQTGIYQGVAKAASDTARNWAEMLKPAAREVGGLAELTHNLTNRIDAGSQALIDYAKQLHEIVTKADAARTALQRLSEGARIDKQHKDEVANARMASELAHVDVQEKQGGLTEEKAVLQRFQIRDRYRREEFERSQQLLAQELYNNSKINSLENERLGTINSQIKSLGDRLASAREYEAIEASASKSAATARRAKKDIGDIESDFHYQGPGLPLLDRRKADALTEDSAYQKALDDLRRAGRRQRVAEEYFRTHEAPTVPSSTLRQELNDAKAAAKELEEKLPDTIGGLELKDKSLRGQREADRLKYLLERRADLEKTISEARAAREKAGGAPVGTWTEPAIKEGVVDFSPVGSGRGYLVNVKQAMKRNADVTLEFLQALSKEQDSNTEKIMREIDGVRTRTFKLENWIKNRRDL